MSRSFVLSTLIFQHSKSGSLSTSTELGLLFQVDWSSLSLWTGFTKELPTPSPLNPKILVDNKGRGSVCWPNNLLDEVHEMICLSMSQQLWLYHHYSPLLCLYLTFLWLYLIPNNSDSSARRTAPYWRKHRQLFSANLKNLQTLTPWISCSGGWSGWSQSDLMRWIISHIWPWMIKLTLIDCPWNSYFKSKSSPIIAIIMTMNVLLV